MSNIRNPILLGLIFAIAAALGAAMLEGYAVGLSSKTICIALGSGIVIGLIVFVISFCYDTLRRTLNEVRSVVSNSEAELKELWTARIAELKELWSARIVDLLPFNHRSEEMIDSDAVAVRHRNLIKEFVNLTGFYEWAGGGRILRQKITTDDILATYAEWVRKLPGLCDIETYKTFNTFIPPDVESESPADQTLKMLNDLPAKKCRLQVISHDSLRDWWRRYTSERSSNAAGSNAYEDFAEHIYKSFREFNSEEQYGKGWEIHYIFEEVLAGLKTYPRECIVINDSIVFVLSEDDKTINLFTGTGIASRYAEAFGIVHGMYKPREDCELLFLKDLKQYLQGHRVCEEE